MWILLPRASATAVRWEFLIDMSKSCIAKMTAKKAKLIYALLWSCSTAIICNFHMSNRGSRSVGWTVVLKLFMRFPYIEHWCLHEFHPPPHEHQTKIVFHRFSWSTSLSILGSVVDAHIFKDASMLANSIAVIYMLQNVWHPCLRNTKGGRKTPGDSKMSISNALILLALRLCTNAPPAKGRAGTTWDTPRGWKASKQKYESLITKTCWLVTDC